MLSRTTLLGLHWLVNNISNYCTSCDANFYSMDSFINEQPMLDVGGIRNLRDIVWLLLFNSFSFCYPENYGRLSSYICYGSSSKTLCGYHRNYHRNSNLHSTSLMGAEHHPPPYFSVAPMMEWTDNHYRTLAHLILKKA